ncbi:MAG: hypothetical protein ABGX21_01665, partial [Candidatus Poseidoniia archaeon]
SKSRLNKANDAAYSAGAVAVLVTPLTRADIDQKWVLMNSPVPDAPGLADLDDLYPDLEEESQALPSLPGLPDLEAPPSPMMPLPEPPKPKRKRTFLTMLALLIVASIGVGASFYLGILEL